MVGRLVRISFVFAIVPLLTPCSSGPLAPEPDPSLGPRALELSVDCDTAEDLSARIAELEADGTLNLGRATALRSKLAQAERWEAEGRPDKAAEALGRLIAQIEGWVADGVLTAEEATDLLACAEDVEDGPDVNWSSISAGGFHTCGLTSGGQAYCWGAGSFNFGQLGDGTNTSSTMPVAVSGGITFANIRAGRFHTCGLSVTGAAFCWGQNESGQLGDGTNTHSNVPVLVSGDLTFAEIGDAGNRHSCGMTVEGDAYCWGDNDFGQLGDGTNVDSNVPVPVAGGDIFVRVGAGGAHTCGLTIAGEAYCWGRNDLGQIGNGSTTSSDIPIAVVGELHLAGIEFGHGHTCGWTASGTGYCWGSNGFGQLGDGTTVDSNVPVAVAEGVAFVVVDAGGEHTCGRSSAGDVYCWGRNDLGQLGDSGDTDSRVPVPLAGGLALVAISAGVGEHTCGLNADRDAYCWGDNFHGQIGDGTNSDRNFPVMVLEP